MPPSQSAQIEELKQIFGSQFGELKALLSEISDRVRSIELNAAGFEPQIVSKIDAAFRRIDDHASRLTSLEQETKLINQSLIELKQTNKIISWIGGLLASTLILWLISQLLHLL